MFFRSRWCCCRHSFGAFLDLVLIGFSFYRRFLEQICFVFDEICQPVDVGHFKRKLGDCFGSSSDISFLFSAMLDVCSVALPVVFVGRLFWNEFSCSERRELLSQFGIGGQLWTDAPRIEKVDAWKRDSMHDGAGSPMPNQRCKWFLWGTCGSNHAITLCCLSMAYPQIMNSSVRTLARQSQFVPSVICSLYNVFQLRDVGTRNITGLNKY